MPDRPDAVAGHRSGTGRRLATVVTLLAVSAAMVYGTWLAVDDMRAKPMEAEARIEDQALCVLNASGFAWLRPSFTLNGEFVPGPPPADLESGATACLPLGTFVDGQGRPWSALGEPAREVTITAFRRPRFRTVNAERRVSGRWPLD